MRGRGENGNGAPRRLPPRRAAAILGAGRIGAAAVPAVLFVLFVGGGSWKERAAAAVLQAVIWALSVRLTLTLGGAALTALGPRVAVGRGILVAALVSTAACVWLPHEHQLAASMLLVAPVAFVASAAWETVALRHVAPAVRLLLVGTSGAAAETLLRDIRRGQAGGYELIGVVCPAGAPGDVPEQVRVLGSVDELDRVIAEHRPDLVVLTPLKHEETFVRLLDAAEAGFRVLELAEFYEYAFGRVPIENLPHEWFMSVLHLYRRPYSRYAKRSVDIVGALVLFVLTLPLFPLLALLVRRTPGPVFLRQVRLGEHGKLFMIYKFRTMRADAERPGQAVWAAGAHDPRITPAGAFLRRLRLDELPQLWNVLRGDMSLVGPRPERPEFLEELSRSVPNWTRRHLVKPGLTGWAQVRQGYTASAEATSVKLSYDLWYLRHRSLTVDFAILLRTTFAVVLGDRSSAAPAPVAAPSSAALAPPYD